MISSIAVRRLALGAFVTICLPAVAAAAPISLGQADWFAAAAGSTIVTETFEGFAEGEPSSPLVLANGVFTTSASGPDQLRIFNTTDWCVDADKCLTVGTAINDTRTFSQFAVGTTLWSVGQMDFFDRNDVFRITVTGGSGTLMLDAPAATFYGFSDPLGVTSVSFLNLGSGRGSGNYTFDDVSTAAGAAAAPVPEPTSMLLLGSGLAGLVARSRRRRSHTHVS